MDLNRFLSRRLISVLAATLAFSLTQTAGAAEGASSNYFPGTYGDYAIAAAPTPGWTYVNYSLFYNAEVDRTVLQGRVNADVDIFAYTNMSVGLYAAEKPVLGGQFAVGAFLPLVDVDFEAGLVGQNFSRSVQDGATGVGDLVLMPVSLFWNSGNWHFNLYELIFTPTGEYELGNTVNIGRNYWSYDTAFALTHLDLETGRDFSLVTGYMINDKNDDTDYDTGNELHMDFMFNQFFSETFAAGLHGYYYKQLEGDSGSGALLGDFKSDSYGIGPSLLWIPESGGGRFSITASWLHDLDATNRMESDYVVISLAWVLGGRGE